MGNLSAPVLEALQDCHPEEAVEQLPASCEGQNLPGCLVKSARVEVTNSQLLRASEHGDIDSIIEALAGGADIETRQLPITIFPGSGTMQEDDFDLPCGADTQEMVDFKDGNLFSADDGTAHEAGSEKMPGLTPLMQAAKGGKAMAVALLLDARATPHSRDEIGMQPLHFAASVGCRESCRYLISARACPATLDEARRDVFACLPHHCVAGSADRLEWQKLLELDTNPKRFAEKVVTRQMLVVPL